MVRWTEACADYARTRSSRYRAAMDIAVEWADEAVADVSALVFDPDPRSRMGGVRIIGYSPSAGFVITVIADKIDGELWGNNAWKASGGDRRAYREAVEGR